MTRSRRFFASSPWIATGTPDYVNLGYTSRGLAKQALMRLSRKSLAIFRKLGLGHRLDFCHLPHAEVRNSGKMYWYQHFSLLFPFSRAPSKCVGSWSTFCSSVHRPGLRCRVFGLHRKKFGRSLRFSVFRCSLHIEGLFPLLPFPRGGAILQRIIHQRSHLAEGRRAAKVDLTPLR